MVGESERHRRLVAEVAALYDWIEVQLAGDGDRAGRCRVCGACCNFTTYDHLLFVTPPELIYLAERLGVESLRQMNSGQCPYQEAAECTVHRDRFAGCRIFCCHGDTVFQGELTETALKRLKAMCERFGVPYRYADLATALAEFATGTGRLAAEPYPGDHAG